MLLRFFYFYQKRKLYPSCVFRVPINIAEDKQATIANRAPRAAINFVLSHTTTMRCAVYNVLTIEVLVDGLLKRITVADGDYLSFGT